MEKYIDLHTHSNCSDGTMTPCELVHHAKESGLSAISLTDHDCISGIGEAVSAGKELGVEVVPGIEFSVQSNTETHILGYYINPEAEAISHTLPEILRVRNERTEDTARKLCELGFNITCEEARAKAGSDLVGRAHFAKVMVEKGYVSSVKEAFENYLGSGKPAFSSKQYLTAEDAVRVIKESGGVSFIAHLHLIRLNDSDLFDFLKRMKEAGLSGIEGYYTEYEKEMHEKYMAMAKELSLAVSGGTDFHGKTKPHIKIGKGYGELQIPYSVLDEIKKLI